MPKDKIKLSDSSTGKMLTIQTTTDSLEKDVKLIVPTVDAELVNKHSMESYIGNVADELNNIKKPNIISPLNNEIDFDGDIVISPYETSTLFSDPHSETYIQIARDINFEDKVLDILIPATERYMGFEGDSEGTYYLRVRYRSGDVVSKWTEVVKFTCINSNISRPVVTVSGGDVNNVDDGFLITINEFSSIEPSENHISTSWRVVDPVTNIVVWESVNDTVNLNKINVTRGVLLNNKQYLVKVNLNGDVNGNSPTGKLMCKTKSEFIYVGDDLNQYVISSYNGVDYFGEVGINQLDGTYNYRGEWGVNSGRPDKDYVVNEQVTYNGVLYKCLKNHTNVTPGTDVTTWQVDVRNNLPTGKWLLDQVGIGYGLTDNNHDGRSSGSVKLGNLKNNDQGWLKYLHNGKLIYIAKKPFVDTIAWTDIAKREAHDGKRTVRIGKHLYYVRLVKQDEYINCLLNSINGNLATEGISSAENTWIHDTQEGVNRKVMSNSSLVSTLAAISRTGSYRPVLEYIPEGSEPYNNIPTGIPTATGENFQYDFYTDTGYFGHVPATSLIGGNSLATNIGLTAGTAQNDTTGYFKFYWHGQILYVCKQTIRHTTSWDHINSVNCIFGKDMGGSGKKTITVGSNTYAVQLLLGGGKSPVDDALYWSDFDTNTEAVFKRNNANEGGRGSQWNDLMYRVHVTVPSNKWSEQDGDINLRNLTGGVQIGKNWASYTNAEMSVYRSQGGNGTVTWCQEVSQRFTNTTRIYRGFFRLSYLYAATPSDAGSGNGLRFSLRLL